MKETKVAEKAMEEIVPVVFQRSQLNIQRCGLATKLKNYDLMQHSYGVLSIVCDLVKIFGLTPLNQSEVEAIMRHDLAETFTGDLPWVVKNMSLEVKESWDKIENAVIEEKSKAFPALLAYTDENIEKALSDVKLKLFKIADMLDLLFYCCNEYDLGNKTEEMRLILENAKKISFDRIKEFCKMDYLKADYNLSLIRAYVKSSNYELLLKTQELDYLED